MCVKIIENLKQLAFKSCIQLLYLHGKFLIFFYFKKSWFATFNIIQQISTPL